MAKPSGRQQVEDFLLSLEHPLKQEIEEVRRIVLSADNPPDEHIKWNAPSFRFDQDDRVTFNFHGKGFFRLVLHRGAKAKESLDLRPHFDDAREWMEWVAPDRATITFTDMNDVEAKRELLKRVVEKWAAVAR